MRICERCGEIIRIVNPRAYAYKRDLKRKHEGLKYFCCWTCMTKWDADHKSRWRDGIEE